MGIRVRDAIVIVGLDPGFSADCGGLGDPRIKSDDD
jgi:hypothetical protein